MSRLESPTMLRGVLHCVTPNVLPSRRTEFDRVKSSLLARHQLGNSGFLLIVIHNERLQAIVSWSLSALAQPFTEGLTAHHPWYTKCSQRLINRMPIDAPFPGPRLFFFLWPSHLTYETHNTEWQIE